MVKPKRPLKRKEQIMMDEQIARDLKVQMQADLEEEQRIAKKKEEEANIAIVTEWDNTHAIMDADYELAAKLQEEERGELSIKEKLKMFVELMNKRKNHFEMLRAEERRRKPPTEAQKRKQMCTYLKNLAGFTHNQINIQMQADLEEEQRIAKKKEEEANIAIVTEWDNTHTMMDADYELAAKLQEEERGELSIKEKLKMFVELMNKRKNHFEMLRAEERRRKPPTEAQKR
nr:hypothetical protein [Tanacetum cinerariifolium]